ncbi:hypothetical protein TMatcc_005596 [Talaromyces marneffei ATCC 18224]|uniref:Cyanovirin-N domain-containing protein n=1 Tax=Talaromyces marneffei (strain ATCC 18224 / CBS 334.59 / QM 7333) TaxID=441960 RepID=B6Q9S1_TALMQ|nr:hypothetical protein PMAA_072350 [Talaromyces marneffei ATCC 18224]
MKPLQSLSVVLCIVSLVAAAPRKPQGSSVAGTTVTRGAQTLVLSEVNGVPGNECLTFRNNGEIVNAACVNTASDRQMTPSTVGNKNVLLVQRSFTAGFRPDLVNVQACVGFNGTDFLAEDCASPNIDFVSFTGGELKSASGACQSGHDNRAQITVDPTGRRCATFTSTVVTPAKS